MLFSVGQVEANHICSLFSLINVYTSTLKHQREIKHCTCTKSDYLLYLQCLKILVNKNGNLLLIISSMFYIIMFMFLLFFQVLIFHFQNSTKLLKVSKVCTCYLFLCYYNRY